MRPRLSRVFFQVAILQFRTDLERAYCVDDSAREASLNDFVSASCQTELCISSHAESMKH